jgi:hypothetical protein
MEDYCVSHIGFIDALGRAMFLHGYYHRMPGTVGCLASNPLRRWTLDSFQELTDQLGSRGPVYGIAC